MSMSIIIENWKRAGMDDKQIRDMLIKICDENANKMKWVLENHPKVVEEYILTTIFIEDKWIS